MLPGQQTPDTKTNKMDLVKNLNTDPVKI